MIPGHLHDPSFFCDELKQSLPFQPIEDKVEKAKEIKKRTEDVKKETFLSEEEHEQLCFNLDRNQEELPKDLYSLGKIYDREKQELKRRINKINRRLNSKQENQTLKPGELEKFELSIQNGKRQFFCEWQPFRQAEERCKINMEEWQKGIDEFQANVKKQIDTWKELKEIWPKQDLLITILYQHGGMQQQQDFQVSNAIKVADFVRLIKKRMGIAVQPFEELRLFSLRGLLKNASYLNQYEPDKISSLKLYKIQQEDPKKSYFE